MLPGLLRLLFYSLFFYVIYRLVRFLLLPSRKKQSAIPKEKKSGFMIKDEICNTYLPKEDAIRQMHEGKEHFFCSEQCRKKFLESHK